jgi:hypothetical protein
MRSIALVSAFALLGAAAGCSYNKQCFGDGVCKITKNGQVTYEGPPDKVAAYQAKDAGNKKQAEELDKAYREAPKRGAAEPIRIVIVANTEASGLAPLMKDYAAMLEQALAQTPRLQVVPSAKISIFLQGSTGSGMHEQPIGATPAVDETLTHVLRDMSGAADIVVVLHTKEKSRSGFVSGGGGAGVAEVVNVEFAASLSSVYAFAPEQSSQVGKSTAGISLSGIDKNGQAQQGELKGKRNPEQDRAALQALASWMGDTIATKIASELPATEAAAEIHKKNGASLLQQLTGH